jgi:NADPH-dependent stearoyl-CoA 9-desaturase
MQIFSSVAFPVELDSTCKVFLRHPLRCGAATMSKTKQKTFEFGQEIEAILHKIEADLGEKDRQHITRICRLSRILEGTGRTLIHFSMDPFTFGAGVLALSTHKQLETAEIGHMALHGAYDRQGMPPKLQSKSFRWKFPVDEESWRYAHNTRHHPFTNIAGKDPDIHFGIVRLTPETPHRWMHYVQLPVLMFFIIPNFSSSINSHVTGLLDAYLGNGLQSGTDFLQDRSWKSIALAHRKAFRKWLPYYAENYIFYPMLAGPFFWKVMLGNYMADKMRDTYTGLTILCGHVGADVKSHESLSSSTNRGEWYIMQIEAAQNFKVSRPLSILCGALDYQIEHHLFPRLPPNRLREVSRDIQACCERYGVHYTQDSWPQTLKKVFKQIAVLSKIKG